MAWWFVAARASDTSHENLFGPVRLETLGGARIEVPAVSFVPSASYHDPSLLIELDRQTLGNPEGFEDLEKRKFETRIDRLVFVPACDDEFVFSSVASGTTFDTHRELLVCCTQHMDEPLRILNVSQHVASLVYALGAVCI